MKAAQMEKTATIEIAKEYLNFSAGHFTIFSATERERLHGHNFLVSAKIESPVDENGLCFNYGNLKQKLKALCDALDEYMLLPIHSPFLNIETTDTEHLVQFNNETLRFNKSDCLLLPLRNTTVEEFSQLLLNRLLEDRDIKAYDIRKIEIRVSSGAGQWGACEWKSCHHKSAVEQ